MALNRDCIGREYRVDATVANADEIRAFAAALGDSQERATAHPLFPIRLMRSLMAKVLDDPELGVDRQRLVHGEQGFEYRIPIRDGDTVALEATVVGIDDKPSGQLLRTEQRLRVRGELAIVGMAVAFIRSSSSSHATSRPRAAPPPAGRGPVIRITYDVDAALARRYADASEDHNPIHVDEHAARAAGFTGVILHGTCTLARAVSEVVRLAAVGDPARLRSVFARFARPVVVPDRLELTMWSIADTDIGFEVRNAADEIVLASGRARLE